MAGEEMAVMCQSCGETLKPVTHLDTQYQFENALWVGLHGGYGMFVDELEKSDSRLPGEPYAAAVICHDCAHDLCDKVPWISDLIKPDTSHSHSYTRQWNGHVGWDLPHKDNTDG